MVALLRVTHTESRGVHPLSLVTLASHDAFAIWPAVRSVLYAWREEFAFYVMTQLKSHMQFRRLGDKTKPRPALPRPRAPRPVAVRCPPAPFSP